MYSCDFSLKGNSILSTKTPTLFVCLFLNYMIILLYDLLRTTYGNKFRHFCNSTLFFYFRCSHC